MITISRRSVAVAAVALAVVAGGAVTSALIDTGAPAAPSSTHADERFRDDLRHSGMDEDSISNAVEAAHYGCGLLAQNGGDVKAVGISVIAKYSGRSKGASFSQMDVYLGMWRWVCPQYQAEISNYFATVGK